MPVEIIRNVVSTGTLPWSYNRAQIEVCALPRYMARTRAASQTTTPVSPYTSKKKNFAMASVY